MVQIRKANRVFNLKATKFKLAPSRVGLNRVSREAPLGVQGKWAFIRRGTFDMRTGIKTGLATLCQDLAMKTGVGSHAIFSVYNYMFDPQQLRFLMDCIQETSSISGCCVEAGCSRGNTTAFLRKWMYAVGIEKDYVAIDTFSGFVPKHAEFEIRSRGKPEMIKLPFSMNKKKWFEYSMRLANISDVKTIEADVADFDFGSIAPISFCLLDVDLYLPISESLPKIYHSLSVGGIIVVDDCQPGNIYDGAMQAYEEFVLKLNIPGKIECGKLGVIRKDRR